MTSIQIKYEPNFRFTAINSDGNEIKMDASPAIGGQATGMRPMELLLAALGGCSGIDVVNILNKQRQSFEFFELVVSGERKLNEIPSLYENIHAKFYFKGVHLDIEKIKKAVKLSMEKYCSVSKTLELTAKINYSIIVNEKELLIIET